MYIFILRIRKTTTHNEWSFYRSLFSYQVVQRIDRFVLRVRDKVAVNFERYRRVAVSHVFADRLYRDVLRQKQAAIGVP